MRFRLHFPRCILTALDIGVRTSYTIITITLNVYELYIKQIHMYTRPERRRFETYSQLKFLASARLLAALRIHHKRDLTD